MPGPSSWWHPRTSIGQLVAVDAVDSSRSGKQRQHALTVTVGCQSSRPGGGLTAEYTDGGRQNRHTKKPSYRRRLARCLHNVARFLLQFLSCKCNQYTQYRPSSKRISAYQIVNVCYGVYYLTNHTLVPKFSAV